MEQIMISNKQNHKNDNNILRRMHRDSQTILSKNKPQVRIIHIFAPEIIKTDPANFRELVQRLTGKPSVSREKLTKKRPKSGGRRVAEEDIRSKVEIVKSEEAAKIWRSSSSSRGSGDYNESGGFLAGFTDMEDGFMQQLGMLQPSLDLLPQNHNPALMHHHQHPYRYNQNQQQQQQHHHHFFGEEDHTHNYRII